MILPTKALMSASESHASRDNTQRLTQPPSYSSYPIVIQMSPTTPPQQMSALNATPSSSSTSALAVSAHTGSGHHAPSDDRDSASASGSYMVNAGSIQEPRYIYYQVYSEGEAIHAKTSFTEEDPFMGRIVSQRVAPPHTAVSIKRFLSKQENISDYNCTNLYATIFSHSALEDQSYVSVETGDGPGSSPQQPMALVISDPPQKKTKKEVEKMEAEERKRKKEAEAKEKKRKKGAEKVDAEERKRKKEAEAEEKKRKKEAEAEEKKRKKDVEKVEAEERKRKKEVEADEKKRKREEERATPEASLTRSPGIPIQTPPNPVPELY